MTSYTFGEKYIPVYAQDINLTEYIPSYTRYITPYDRAWDMGVFSEYMTVYDGICQVVRIPDADRAASTSLLTDLMLPHRGKRH
jgi:hypothetical protein